MISNTLSETFSKVRAKYHDPWRKSSTIVSEREERPKVAANILNGHYSPTFSPHRFAYSAADGVMGSG